MKGLRIVLSAGFILLCMIPGVSAQDAASNQITFTIPVRLYDLHPNVQKVLIKVIICDNIDDVTNPIGRENVQLDIPENGNLEQDVEVVVTLNEGYTLENAVRWDCDFVLYYTGSDGGLETGGPSTHEGVPIELRARDDHPFNPSRSGLF